MLATVNASYHPASCKQPQQAQSQKLNQADNLQHLPRHQVVAGWATACSTASYGTSTYQNALSKPVQSIQVYQTFQVICN